MCKTIKCAECGAPFARGRVGQTFCTPAHKATFHNRSGARGRALIPMMLAWRQTRGKGDTAKRSFYEVCRILDEWNAEDLKAGRARPDTFVGRQFAQSLNRHFRA